MFNKSQWLIIGVITTSMLGIPDINEVFTREIIKVASVNPTLFAIILISVLKIALVLASLAWLFQLAKNIEFTYNNHSENTFYKYLLKLVLTGLIAFIVMKLVFG